MTEPTEEPADGECPRCASPYEPGQDYCLDCGMRLPPAGGVVPRMAAAWQRRLPWYPGDWIWPALLGLVVAVAGVVGAILYSHYSGSASSPIVATTRVQSLPVTTAPPATDTGAVAPPAPTITVATTAENPPRPSSTSTPTTPAQPGLTSWPAGRNGYTVVLESLPAGGSGPATALRRARQALAAGLPQVGVLESGKYSSLHPGYFVVFSGVYSSLGAAQNALSAAHAKGFPAAYAREITT